MGTKVVAEDHGDLERSRGYDRKVSRDTIVFDTFEDRTVSRPTMRTTCDVDVLQTQAFRDTFVYNSQRIPTGRLINLNFRVLTFKCDEFFRTIRSAML